MSEYQYVAFRAIDQAVSERNLAFMRQQSSRAAITPWSFENEYHFGDFHGNVVEMLRRGYDIHLHYANFGVRTLLIRLPYGFPNARVAKPYLADDSLRFVKDKQGPGGTLAIEPYYEPGDLDELWDLNEILDRLVPLRSEILAGDLRPLYLTHLAAAHDGNHAPEATIEAPVPAGLGKPTDAQRALAEFYGLSDALIAAAAQQSSPLPVAEDQRAQYAKWVADQPEATKDAWLVELLSDSGSSARSKIRAEFEKVSSKPSWPTVQAGRTIAQLEALAKELERERKQEAAAKAARQRAKRLQEMAADPTLFLRETERLVRQRSTEAYQQVSETLADLREALAGSKQAGLAEKQALKLKSDNPTLRHLTAALRRHGFVPKQR
jgi:hypothetical protein